MSFSFGFAGDDIEDDDERESLTQDLADCSISQLPTQLPAKSHDLKGLLSSLPSRLAFNILTLPIYDQARQAGRSASVGPEATAKVTLPRRALFDIRAQLMAEADPLENDNDELLTGLEAGDLTSGIYEGGFKTWECALDLASFASRTALSKPYEDWHIIELGAGSAVPSIAIFAKILEESGGKPKGNIRFSLCDYNEAVLRLVTGPNVFLAGLQMNGVEDANTRKSSDEDHDELEIDDIDESRVQLFLAELEKRHLSFDFVSGAWSTELVDLIQGSPEHHGTATNTLILASETIYSPVSIEPFTSTIVELLRRGGSRSRAYVAAKRVYFGVGGGVDDFVREATAKRATVEEVLDIRTEGVGRVILQVTLPET